MKTVVSTMSQSNDNVDSAFDDDDVTDEEELDAGLPSRFRAISAKIVKRRQQLKTQLANPGGGYGQQNGGGGYGAILQRFAGKVQQVAEQQPKKQLSTGKANKINLFVSYCWLERKEAVHEMAKFFMQQPDFNVWIDMVNMAETSASTFEAMAKGIDEADIVVVFFSRSYAESANCRREIEYAANKNKEIIPIRVEKNYRPDGWLLFIFKSQLRFNFCEGDNMTDVALKVCDQIRRVGGPQVESAGQNVSTKTVAFEATEPLAVEAANYKTVGIPFFSKSKYFAREEDEQRILSQFRLIAEAPDEGCLVVSGDGGVGKTTLMARLLTDEKNASYYDKQCNFQRVIWINCFDWREQFDDKAFVDRILTLAKDLQGDGNGESATFPSLQSISSFYKRKGQRVAFVLDDMFNYRLLQSFLEKHSEPCICFVVTRDAQTIMETNFSIVQKVERVEELSDDGIRDMLKSTYKLNRFLGEDQLLKLAQLSCGLPLIASLIAARLNNCESKNEAKSEYKVLTSPQYRISDLKTKDRSFKTVSNLFAFSLDQMDMSMRMLFYAFLLFNPAEPVSIFDLGVLWGFDLDEDSRCGLRGVCRAFEKRSLVRRVKRNLTEDQLDEEVMSEFDEIHPTLRYNDEFEDRFLVHQMLYESAIEKAKKDFKLPDNLKEQECLLKIRVKIASGDIGSYSVDFGASRQQDKAGLGVFLACLKYRRRHLLERLVAKLDEISLASFCKKRCEDGRVFLHHLYWFKWDNNPDQVMAEERYAVNTSYRLVRRISKKLFVPECRSLLYEIYTTNQILPADSTKPTYCLIVDYWEDNDHNDMLDHILLTPYTLEWQNEAIDMEWESSMRAKSKSMDKLLWAVFNNDFEESKRLIQEDVDGSLDYGESLLTAARKGYLDLVKILYDRKPDAAAHIGSDGMNSLSMAAKNGHIQVLEYLYEKWPEGLAENATKKKNEISAFMIACKYGDLKCVKFMAEHHPQCVWQVDDDNMTCLIIAALDGRYEVCKYLLDNHPSLIFEREKDLQATAAGFAAVNGHLETFKLLYDKLKEDADKLNAVVMAASAERGFEPLKYIWEKDPHVFKQTDPNTQLNALITASTNGHFANVEFLWDRCDAKIVVDDGKKTITALERAVKGNHFELVQWIYQKDPSLVNVKKSNGKTLLDVAKLTGNKQIIKFIEDVFVNS